MQVLNIFHVLIAIAMVAFILIQKGAGATAGAAFGSGASGTVFGARGAGNFLSRSTWVLATLFCLISLTMAVMASRLGTEPETDLGVVATAPVAEEAASQAAPDLPVELKSADPSDVPSMETVIAQPEAELNAGDMPAIEATPESVPPSDGSEDDTSGDDGN
ncbi:MAG TPA: preprotein translocase subunit SecG [Xanthomonadales bacterium]